MTKQLMKLFFTTLTITLMVSLVQSAASAKLFRNAYVSFEMMDNWKCVLEQTEWICRSEGADESKQAVIILTAKEVGPTDSFDAYETHLNAPQTIQIHGGASQTSKVVYAAKRSPINDQIWVDGLHLGSEIPNYFTRYMATIKDQISVLVTFTAHKDFYTKYSPEFFKSVNSLRIIASKNILSSGSGQIRPSTETLGASINAAIPADMTGGDANMQAPQVKSSNKKNKMLILGGALLAIIVGLVLFLKNRR